MSFLRNPVTTGPGTAVVVRAPYQVRAFLVDNENNYRYGLRQPFQPTVTGNFVVGPGGVWSARLRAPYFATWWLIVDSPLNSQPQATFTVEPDADPAE